MLTANRTSHFSRKCSFLYLPVFLSLVAATAWAQSEERFYVGAEIGALRSPAVTVIGDSNDRSSLCDEFINPLYASIPGCTATNRGEGDNYQVPFDGTAGTLANAFVGYQVFPHLHAELEYVTRTSNYGQRSGVRSAQGVNFDKLSDEISLAEEWLGTVTSRGLMANVYWSPSFADYISIRPYAGVGIGFGSTRVGYGSVWSRSTSPDDIATGSDQPNADDIARNLAGTASSAHDTMKDTQLTYQFLIGFSYPVRESVSIDVRARWMVFQEFEGIIVWDPLRSHVPNIRKDGSEPVHGAMSTDDLSFLGISIGMKHHF